MEKKKITLVVIIYKDQAQIALSRLVSVGRVGIIIYFLLGGTITYSGMYLKQALTLVFLNSFCGSCTAYISNLSTLDDRMDGSIT